MSTEEHRASVRSALYQGTVVHDRPRHPRHRFAAPVAMPLVFFDELEAIDRLHPLVNLNLDDVGWSWSIMRLRRQDYLGPKDLPLGGAVRQAVGAAGGEVRGPVGMLANLRTWGWLFNPLTVYFCLDQSKERVEWTVLEVSNTPWHERHVYVVGSPGEHRFAKRLHVSPFLGMDVDYVLRYTAPDAQFHLELELWGHGQEGGGEGLHLRATMDLEREALSRQSLAHLLWRPPRTLGVSLGIYTEALRLALAGAPFHPHPDRRGRRVRCR